MPYVRNSISEHLGLDTEMTVLEVMGKSLLSNIRLLSPLNYGLIGAVAAMLFILLLFVFPVYTNRVKLRSHFNWGRISFYAALGLIPYLRFVAIPYHSLEHAFFVYRAQAATILALCFIVLELVEPVTRKAK